MALQVRLPRARLQLTDGRSPSVDLQLLLFPQASHLIAIQSSGTKKQSNIFMSSQTVTFQEDTMNQLYLPMDFSDLIPEDHVARIVSDMIDALDDQLFFDAYKGGGRPAYHPKMMAKIVLYGYTQSLFSARAIEGALTEHLPMMWMAASQTPDFNTINRFRSERCKSLMDTLYPEMVRLLIEEGYVDGRDYFYRWNQDRSQC